MAISRTPRPGEIYPWQVPDCHSQHETTRIFHDIEQQIREQIREASLHSPGIRNKAKRKQRTKSKRNKLLLLL